MEERQVSVDGVTYVLETPFMVIATQNPIEMEGTYPLPEAQRDRFTAAASVGYPSPAAELEMLEMHGAGRPHRGPRAGRRRARGPQAGRGRAQRARLRTR
jgi:MoxR-like ATPase